MKADSIGIKLHAVFDNSILENGPLIVHDEQRIQQVLLNL